jgi:iodotyrosine deiodinase
MAKNIDMTKAQFVPLLFQGYTEAEMRQRADDFYVEMKRRRSVRDFSDRPVPHDVIENCIRTAGTAPSGANQQPWHFIVVSDPEIKRQIRMAAEEEERAFYSGRAPKEWREALAHLGTDANKPFLESSPYLIVIFAQSYGIDEQGEKVKNYYVSESVGIATGMLITALHHAGLATLTHTPSPMGFLSTILQRPANERPYLILVTGYPAEGTQVPNIDKKFLEDIATMF